MEDKKLECIHYINSLNLPLHIISWIPLEIDQQGIQFKNLMTLNKAVINYDKILYYKNNNEDFISYLKEINILEE